MYYRKMYSCKDRCLFSHGKKTSFKTRGRQESLYLKRKNSFIWNFYRFYNPTLGNIENKKVRKHKTKSEKAANEEHNKENLEDNTITLDRMELKKALDMREEQHKKLSDEYTSMLYSMMKNYNTLHWESIVYIFLL